MDIPYLILTDELWLVFREYFGENYICEKDIDILLLNNRSQTLMVLCHNL